MIRRVMLLRHAEAARPSGVGDRDRPLTQLGQRQAAAAGHALSRHEERPALVIVSPSRRTRETWEAVEGQVPHGEVRSEPSVYEAGVEDLLALLQRLPDETASVMMVGHNPGIAATAGQLLGSNAAFALPSVPPATAAVIACEGAWVDLGTRPGQLAWSWLPPAEL